MLLRILPFILLLTILPPLWMDRYVIRPLGKRSLRWICAAPYILLILAAVVLVLLEDYTPEYGMAVGHYFIAFLAFCVPALLYTLCGIAARLFRRVRPVSRTLQALGAVLAFGTFYLIYIGYTQGTSRIETTRTDFYSPDLPKAFEGFTVAQISDWHLGTTYGKNTDTARRIVAFLQHAGADAVVFTGDLVTYNADELKPFKEVLSELTKAGCPVYAIMGNHDYVPYYKWPSEEALKENIRQLQQAEREMGWHLLLNESCIVRRGNDSIAIVGVENDGNPPFPQYGDLPKALRNVPDSLHERPFFKILLSHDPTHWRRRVLPETDIQLMLAGHTHAMQLKLFGWSPASWVYKEWGGLYEEGNRALYVNTGLGTVGAPFRYGAWPQIELITLHRK